MSKYEPLWRYLKENKKDSYKLSYEEIRKKTQRLMKKKKKIICQ